MDIEDPTGSPIDEMMLGILDGLSGAGYVIVPKDTLRLVCSQAKSVEARHLRKLIDLAEHVPVDLETK